MDARQRELWSRLEAFRFDPPAVELTFVQRLARDCGWSLGHARAVVQEYRRFLLLAMSAGHPVTPSEDVDQAWHLHLAYSRSYWGELCGQVLGRPLHHGPTQGGRSEDRKFRCWYARTLTSYERLFGAPAPVALWPPVERRFADPERFRRIDSHANWVVPRHRVACTGMALSALLAASCVLDDEHGTSWFFLAGLVTVAFLLLRRPQGGRLRRRSRRRGTGNGGSDNGCGVSAGACGFDSTHHAAEAADSGCGDSGCGASGCGGGGCGGD